MNKRAIFLIASSLYPLFSLAAVRDDHSSFQVYWQLLKVEMVIESLSKKVHVKGITQSIVKLHSNHEKGVSSFMCS